MYLFAKSPQFCPNQSLLILTQMTSTVVWGTLPRELADVLETELGQMSDEILRAIGEEVPEYARPLEGAFGEAVRGGVAQALERFVALVRDPELDDMRLSRAYIALGREELRAGRTLDALQSAYRVGARVAWRRIAATTAAAGFEQAVISRLAEAIFAYIDELSAESIEGYSRARSELAGEHERLRHELLRALLRPAAPEEIARLAERLGWRLPRGAAALACEAERTAGLAGRLGSDVLASVIDGTGCIVVPDAGGPGRTAMVRVAAGPRRAALGPQLELGRLADSWRLAAGALELNCDRAGLVLADEHLAELMLREASTVIERIVLRRLSGLDGLTPRARERTVTTALAYVQHRGNAAAMARALEIHPQTVRYRIARLRELLGEQLEDPDARFELEAALRASGSPPTVRRSA